MKSENNEEWDNFVYDDLDTSSVNFVSDLNIDTTGYIYQAIQLVSFSYFDKSTTSGTDKFWLLSYSEVENLLCGGTWNNSKANWNSSSSYDTYWLRTLNGDVMKVHDVNSSGGIGYNDSTSSSFIRPAFQIA